MEVCAFYLNMKTSFKKLTHTTVYTEKEVPTTQLHLDLMSFIS